ncbi:hypothetical protein HK101_005381 [Irineochytrium annulatum]|nr:hypothetical protein HK101_005381 [Irineochytrium annulatum]
MAAASQSMQSLKDGLLSSNSTSQEEQVSVNQRHLIDKASCLTVILARYSAENTIYRELLQNSNDAGASEVEIHFKTDPSLSQALAPTLSLTSVANAFMRKAIQNVTSVTYKNNGRPFSGDDWNRLKKIAEGNPDEAKVGFFGVGFYCLYLVEGFRPYIWITALFSICEEPFVTSGNECMLFFWKGDQLFTKKANLEAKDQSPLTSFFLALRDPIETPNVAEFGRFIATSLAFTKNLRKVEVRNINLYFQHHRHERARLLTSFIKVFVDDDRILSFGKKAGDLRPLTFPRGAYTMASPNAIFDLKSVNISKVQMDVVALIDHDKSRNRSGTKIEQTIFMRTASGTCGVRLSSHLAKEMERTTKKRAPALTDVNIQFSNFDEYESSSSARGKSFIFDELIPGPKEQGRIFIGFPTHQTTGCSMQLAAHLIPTVERESIDFVDRNLNVWNQDLLTIGGLLARIIYEDEMASIAELHKELALDAQSEQWLNSKASHALACFTFRPSTPHGVVGRIHDTYFYKCTAKPICMMSTKGILPAASVRLPDATMKSFIKDVALVPEAIMSANPDLMNELERRQLIRRVGLEDVFVELNARVLTAPEVVALMKWWLAFKSVHSVSVQETSKLLTLLLIVKPAEAEGKPRRAIDLKHFVNPQIIPPTVLLPDSVLPLEISKSFTRQEIQDAFRLTELSLTEWVEFSVKHPDFAVSPSFVEKVMGVIARQHLSLSKDVGLRVVGLLKTKMCIVTTQGLKLPDDTYFKNVTLFTDLPIVAFENMKPFTEAFLKALGVREYVELQMIFSRLQDLKWDSDHVQLVKYLASVQSKLTSIEISRLKLTPIFPKEDLSIQAVSSSSLTSTEADTAKPPVAPRPRYKAEDLYVPGETLRSLDMPIIDWPGKQKWRTGSDEAKLLAVLGLQSAIPWTTLVEQAASSTPDRRAKLLAYFIDNHKAVYSTTYVPTQVRVAFLPSQDGKLYKPFEIFADPSAAVLGFPILHAELKQGADKFGVQPHPPGAQLVAALSRSPPTPDKAVSVFSYLVGRQSDWRTLQAMKFIPIQKSSFTEWVQPTKVYFGSAEASPYGGQFQYIDFGSLSNAFLRSCGVKNEPTPQELTEQVVRDPHSFLELGFPKYLQLLRTIAANYPLLQRNSSLVKEMKRAPVETILEEMYADLGSEWLSKQVVEETKPLGQAKASARTAQLQTLIHDRALLLLYDGQQVRAGKEVNTGAESILKTLNVVEVPDIVIERAFRGVVKTQKTTSCMIIDRRSGKPYLFITGKDTEIDYFDVASALGRVIFRQCRLNDALLLSTLLQTSLVNLKRKGFPVDRVLRLQKGKLEAAIAHREAERHREEERQREAERKAESNVALNQGPETSRPPVPPKAINAPAPAVLSIMQNIAMMFPDIEPGFLRSLVESEKGSGEQIIAKIANRLIEEDYPKASVPPSRTSTPKTDETPPAYNSAEGSPSRAPGAWPEDRKTVTRAPSTLPPPADDLLGSFLSNVRKQLPDFGWGIGATPSKPGTAQRPTAGPSRIGNSAPIEDVSPAYTAGLKSELERSLSSVRQTSESSFHASIPAESQPDPGEAHVPTRHTRTTCAPILDGDLVRLRVVKSVPFYVDRTSIEGSKLLDAAALMRFVQLLRFLSEKVFGLEPGKVNVYWDKTGSTVAFNRGKVLFFNLRFYLGLHWKQGLADGMRGEEPETFYYWFMTMCHELAHNFVGEHNR